VQEFAPTGIKRRNLITLSSRWKVVALAFLSIVPTLGVVVPLGAICYWLARYSQTASNVTEMLPALWHSVSASAMAALLCTTLAFPIVYLTTRHASRLSRSVERIVYFGYAVPSFVFALGMLFFVLRTLPMLYQGLIILVLAYALRFLAEATGPLRSALLQASPRLEEAARSLGCNQRQAFQRVTFPMIRRGIFVSMAFIFLACMKELPVTFILSPPGYDTLAVSAWGYIDDAGFAEAAPYALAIFIFSALFVGLLLMEEKQTV